MTRGAAALAAAMLLACAPEPEVPVGPPFTITGTFSDERTRVIIDDEDRAHVGDHVVPITYDATGDCHRVSFDLPRSHFTGCLGKHALVGAFRHAGGTEERVYLVRQP